MHNIEKGTCDCLSTPCAVVTTGYGEYYKLDLDYSIIKRSHHYLRQCFMSK